MSIRSGRFKSPKTIIKGRSDTYFRILNSAEFNNTSPNINAITITFGAGMGDTIDLLPTFSVDLCVQGSGDVSVAKKATGVIEGMYEAMPNPDFNSGRFKTKDPMNPTLGVIIISPGSGNARAIYRIFNTGPTPIQLVQANPNGMGAVNFEAPINESESLDFVTPVNKMILVKGTLTATDHIEGIYNFIAKI